MRTALLLLLIALGLKIAHSSEAKRDSTPVKSETDPVSKQTKWTERLGAFFARGDKKDTNDKPQHAPESREKQRSDTAATPDSKTWGIRKWLGEKFGWVTNLFTRKTKQSTGSGSDASKKEPKTWPPVSGEYHGRSAEQIIPLKFVQDPEPVRGDSEHAPHLIRREDTGMINLRGEHTPHVIDLPLSGVQAAQHPKEPIGFAPGKMAKQQITGRPPPAAVKLPDLRHGFGTGPARKGKDEHARKFESKPVQPQNTEERLTALKVPALQSKMVAAVDTKTTSRGNAGSEQPVTALKVPDVALAKPWTLRDAPKKEAEEPRTSGASPGEQPKTLGLGRAGLRFRGVGGKHGAFTPGMIGHLYGQPNNGFQIHNPAFPALWQERQRVLRQMHAAGDGSQAQPQRQEEMPKETIPVGEPSLD